MFVVYVFVVYVCCPVRVYCGGVYVCVQYYSIFLLYIFNLQLLLPLLVVLIGWLVVELVNRGDSNSNSSISSIISAQSNKYSRIILIMKYMSLLLDKYYYLLPKIGSYKVGREGVDIKLTTDSSVSDFHAKFYIHLHDAKTLATFEIEDLSKHGIYLNENIRAGQPIPKGKRQTLKHCDRMRFGSGNCILTVQQHLFSVRMSSLDENVQMKIYNIVLGLGCNVVTTAFQIRNHDYTHLTIKEDSFSVLFLHALITQKQIVNVDFWYAIHDIVTGHKNVPLPQPDNFRPKFAQPFDLSPKAHRRFIFSGFVFVFFHDDHVQTYASLLQHAGARYRFVEKSIDRKYFLKVDVVGIIYESPTEPKISERCTKLAGIFLFVCFDLLSIY